MVPPATPQPSPPKRSFPLWSAALPGLLIAIYLVVRTTVQFASAAKAINPSAAGSQNRVNSLACIETYSVTLDSSQLYVPEWQAGIPMNSGSPSQPSTVLRGMALNSCGENLKNVQLRFVVHDDAGKRGDGFFQFPDIAAGEAKPFEKAWMGRVTSYEIAAVH
jgi:hypothetical protein